MDFDRMYDEIDALWPKTRPYVQRVQERNVIEKFVKDEDAFARLKSAVEIKVEDSPNKLPLLFSFIEKFFRVTNKPGDTTPEPQSAVEHKSSVQLPIQDNQDVENIFSTIFECWPDNLGITEQRSKALAAFSVACRTETPENIQKACQAYSDAFNAGGMTYPQFLRNFLSDPDTVEEWLAKFNNKTGFSDFVMKQFEAAYAWYPEFTSKSTEKTKKASLVMWYRSVPKDERLDFMLSCKFYAEHRRSMAADFDQPMDEEVTFTKSFNTFVGEWKSLVDKHQAAFVKRDFISKDVKLLALENDIDLTNLYGGGMWEDFFSEKAFPCFLLRCPTIKDAIKAMLEKTREYVADMVAGENKSIVNKELAIRQTGAMDVEKVTEAIFSKIVETKSIVLPRPRS